MTPNGPRIIFKDDRDSSIQRGCHLYGGHFRPEMAQVIYQVAQTCPSDVRVFIVSEGFRDIREDRDLHQELRAFDISLNTIIPPHTDRKREEKDLLAYRRERGLEWANRIRKALGRDYHVVLHGEGYNCHIHIELDPR